MSVFLDPSRSVFGKGFLYILKTGIENREMQNKTETAIPIEELRKKYIHLLKKNADRQCVFEPFQRKDEPAQNHFIPSPNVPEIFDHMSHFSLRRLKQQGLSETDFVKLAKVYVQSVSTLYHYVHEHHANLITNKRDSKDNKWFWETSSFPLWTDLYVRACLSRVWTETFNELVVLPKWGGPQDVGKPFFQEPQNEHLQSHFRTFCEKAEQTLYPVLLARHVHPHVFMDVTAIGQKVLFDGNRHKRINDMKNASDCVTVIIPCVQVNFSLASEALVFTHSSPGPCEQIVWPFWGSESYDPSYDDADDSGPHHDSNSIVVNPIYPVCDSRLIQQLSVQSSTVPAVE